MTPIKTYLASSSRDVSRVAKVHARLNETGLFAFESMWWVHANRWAGKDAELTVAEQSGIANETLRCVARAELFWWLAPPHLSGGSPIEYGAAVTLREFCGGRGPHILVTGNGNSRTLFTSLADFRDESDELGIAAAIKFAEGLRR